MSEVEGKMTSNSLSNRGLLGIKMIYDLFRDAAYRNAYLLF